MNYLRKVESSSELEFGKIVDPEVGEELIPMIIVDSQSLSVDGIKAIRMQGWGNREAVDITIDTGLVTFWSRTKKKIWTKGEESGNTLTVRKLYTDCDSDCLLIDAIPAGPTCHTGEDSCFEISDTEINASLNLADSESRADTFNYNPLAW